MHQPGCTVRPFRHWTFRYTCSQLRCSYFGIGRAALPMLLSGCREDSQDTPGDFDKVSA